jgi:hypothetical protein
MAHEHMRTAVSGGNIRRSRVIFQTAEWTANEMSTNLSFPPLGIAQEWGRYPPGTPFDVSNEAARSGDEVLYYAPGSVGLAECGGTVTGGKVQTVDSAARIVDATGSPPWSFHAVCKALEDGSAGDVVRVEVLGR